MNEIRDLIVGIDFARGGSQITYYDRRAGEPRSVPEKAGSADFEIPTRLCLGAGRKEYCIGSEALYFANGQGGILTDDLYELALTDTPVQLQDQSYPVHELLARYLSGLLDVLGISDVVRNTRCLMLAVRELTPVLVRNLSMACEEIGFGRDEYSLLDYSQCFFYYAMTQRRENWNRNIGWYQFQGNDVTFRKLSVTSGAPPVLIRLRQAGRRTLPEELLDRDTVFTGFVKETLSDELYSCILITGEGFSRDWSSRSARVMCQQQRKVYYGNNLFSKGACAAGKERREDRILKNYRFLSDSMILTNVGMDMRVGGASAYVPLIDAGRNWYEYHIDFELILDGEKELVFLVSGAGENISRKAVMALDGLPSRPPRTTRLQILMQYTSRELCHVEVRDLGFGEMFPSSGKVWREEIDWAGSLPAGSAAAPEVVPVTAPEEKAAQTQASGDIPQAGPEDGAPVRADEDVDKAQAGPEDGTTARVKETAETPRDIPKTKAPARVKETAETSRDIPKTKVLAGVKETAETSRDIPKTKVPFRVEETAETPRNIPKTKVSFRVEETVDIPRYKTPVRAEEFVNRPPEIPEDEAPARPEAASDRMWDFPAPVHEDKKDDDPSGIQLWSFVRQRRSRHQKVKRRRRRLARRRTGSFRPGRQGPRLLLQEEQL